MKTVRGISIALALLFCAYLLSVLTGCESVDSKPINEYAMSNNYPEDIVRSENKEVVCYRYIQGGVWCYKKEEKK